MRGVLQFGHDSFALEEIDGSIAGGRVAGSMSFERGDDGLSLDSHVRFAGTNLAELLPGDGALAGRATVDLDLQGTGRSPIALIGALKGDGTFTIQDGQIMRVDPSAFAAVIRSVDEGLPIDAARIRDRMEAALGNGALNVALAQGEIVVAAGQLRLANTAVRAKGAELGVSLGLDLAGSAIDARLVLSGAAGAGALEGVASRNRAGAARADRRAEADPRCGRVHQAGWRCAPSRRRTSASTRCSPDARCRSLPGATPAQLAPSRRQPHNGSCAALPTRSHRPRRSRKHRRDGRRRRKAPPPTDIRPPAAAKAAAAEAGATAAAPSGVSFLA